MSQQQPTSANDTTGEGSASAQNVPREGDLYIAYVSIPEEYRVKGFEKTEWGWTYNKYEADEALHFGWHVETGKFYASFDEVKTETNNIDKTEVGEFYGNIGSTENLKEAMDKCYWQREYRGITYIKDPIPYPE